MEPRSDQQEILTRVQAMRTQAQQTRQRAARARQDATLTCLQARLTELRGLMPGASAMTCEITSVILAKRGLLGDP
jgi:hypothetical protein